MDSTLPPQLIQLHPFVELFQINRLIKICINSTTWAKFGQDLSTRNKKQHEILTKLYESGIKIYMSKHYNDDQCDDIDLLYSLSCQTFPKEWSTLLSLHKSNETENRFWSCQDVVMCSFQYLDFLSLNCCCLACSNFLFISFNPNSVYRLNLNDIDKLDEQVLNHVKNMHLRGWKRLSNVKHLNLNVSSLPLEIKEIKDKDQSKSLDIYVSPNFVNGLLSIGTIEILNIKLKSYSFHTVYFILQLSESRLMSNTNSIKQFTFIVSEALNIACYIDKDYCRLTNCQLKLLNCEKCVLSNVHFQVALSNKCQYVQLKNKCFINVLSVVQDDDKVFDSGTQTEKFVQRLIISTRGHRHRLSTHTDANKLKVLSDLSGIKMMELNSIYFGGKYMNWMMESVNWQIIQVLCNRLCNIRRVKIIGASHRDLFRLWQELTRNNFSKVKIDVDSIDFIECVKRINQYGNESQGSQPVQSNDNCNMRLIAHNVFLKSNSMRDIAALKAFLKHSLQTEKVELVSLALDTCTGVADVDPNDLLNGFFGISTSFDNNSWQLQPHSSFSKIDCKDGFKQHDIFVDCDNSKSCRNNINRYVGYKLQYQDVVDIFEKKKKSNVNNVIINSATDDHDQAYRILTCEMGTPVVKEIVKVEVLLVNDDTKRVFLHYGHNINISNQRNAGGYHDLPNDNLYPPSFIGRKRMIRLFKVSQKDGYRHWHSQTKNLKCIRICMWDGDTIISATNKANYKDDKGENGKKHFKRFKMAIAGQTLIEIMSCMIDINQERMSKVTNSIDCSREITMVGLNINVQCNIFDESINDKYNIYHQDGHKQIDTILKLFQSIEKLILKSIPIDIKIGGIIKYNEKNVRLLNEYKTIFESVFDKRHLYKVPKCCNKYWQCLETFAMTFSKGDIFDMDNEKYQLIFVHVQTAERKFHSLSINDS